MSNPMPRGLLVWWKSHNKLLSIRTTTVAMQLSGCLKTLATQFGFSSPYVLEIFSTCIFSDEEFESEIRF